MRFMKQKQLLLLFVCFFVVTFALPTVTNAYTPYDTNYKDNYNRLIWTQSAYYPVAIIGNQIVAPDPKDPSKIIPSPLNQPKGMFIDDKDNIYIADTGNNRIVQLDEQGKLVRIIDSKGSPFSKPEGVFVDSKNQIFVADTANKRVVMLDSTGKLIKEFKRPVSKFLPEAFKYDPIKLVVDKRGFLYIVTLGGYQGLLQLDPDGNFIQFFGANKTAFSVMDAFKRAVYTREMYLRELSKLPGSVSNIKIDQSGFIYTVTQGIDTGQIKKLNIAGKDLLAAKNEYSLDTSKVKTFGEFRFANRDKLKPQLADLAVDSDGNITTIDTALKYVDQYDASGNLLFFWAGNGGSTATKLGNVKKPSAIAANSKKELLILDEENNNLQLLRLSEFGELVHKANSLTQEGRYEDSEKPWKDVLRLNSSYTPAIMGLAKAAYKKGDFENAENLFFRAGLVQGYSDSFWQIRLKWFQRNFSILMNTVIGFMVLFIVLNRLAKKFGIRNKWRNRTKSTNTLVLQLKHVFYIMRHPIDGFSAIRYENKGSVWSSAIIFILAITAYALAQVYTSFTFNPSAVLDISLGTILIQFLVIYLGWVVSNYLISSIYRGEGRFRDVAYGTAYALFPYVIVGIPVTIISNVFTLSEGSIFNFFQTGMVVWIALLLFWKVQSLQNYSVGETIMNIFLSLITMTILGVLLFLIFGLSSELKDFIYSIYQEVTIR